MQYATVSQVSARRLLSAWASADPHRICSVADQAETLSPASLLEAERMEVIAAACRVLRRWSHGVAEGPELDASLHVLRHFAEA